MIGRGFAKGFEGVTRGHKGVHDRTDLASLAMLQERVLLDPYKTVNNTEYKKFAYKALNNKKTLHIFRIFYCFICKVSLLFSALYAKCPDLVLYMQSVLII